MKFILSLLVVSNLFFSIVAHPARYALPYDNAPITKSGWEQIDIKFDNGYAKLLRPIAYAHEHGLIVGGHVQMNLTEFGMPHAKITVIAVKALSQQIVDKIHHLPKRSKPIIGIYIHKTKDVQTYRFTDKQGHLSLIHSTSNHPFYVKNLHAYIPIGQVTNTMQLTGKHNEIIHLACSKSKYMRCGTPYHNKRKIMTVYNIEVYQQHYYRVGINAIKVHNDCTLLKQAFGEDLFEGLINEPKEINIGKKGLVYGLGESLEKLYDHDPSIKVYALINDQHLKKIAGYARLRFGENLFDGEHDFRFMRAAIDFYVQRNLPIHFILDDFNYTKINNLTSNSSIYSYKLGYTEQELLWVMSRYERSEYKNNVIFWKDNHQVIAPWISGDVSIKRNTAKNVIESVIQQEGIYYQR